MANNTYCTTEQLGAYLDIRVLGPLANDSTGPLGSIAVQQQILDDQAAYMESRMAGIYGPPFPIVDPTTGSAPIECRRFVGISAVAILLGHRLAQFPSVAMLWRDMEKWLIDIANFQASLRNVQRLSTFNPALVSSGNMSGGDADDVMPFMATPGFVTRPAGTTSATWSGNESYTNAPGQSGVGS